MTEQLDLARAIMLSFAEDSGIVEPSSPRRYLWTDAYAVCNFLSLWRATGRRSHLELATRLVQEVHQILGRHRVDDPRTGWLSGMSGAEAQHHPTAAGLRIGKQLPERSPNAVYDEQEEWDRDGQYFHYLTKWAHALQAMANATGEPRYHRWATELMALAYHRFRSTEPPHRLYWKMRIDLSEPLVAASSPHDALDGAVTCLSLSMDDPDFEHPALAHTIDGLLELCKGQFWQTTDPLGLGGLLFDATRLAQLRESRQSFAVEPLLEQVLKAAVEGLSHFAQSATLEQSATQRLAFRELGLVIGLRSLDMLYRYSDRAPASLVLLDHLRDYRQLGDSLLHFWMEETHRHTAAWLAHADINNVMLASSLVPSDLLAITPPDTGKDRAAEMSTP